MKGKREHYKPVTSVLCNSSDPLEIAVAFRNRLGLKELYIADLDAIRNPTGSNHHPIIEKLSCREKFEIILDAGVSDIQGVSRWLDLGVRKVVIGSETLDTLEDLNEITAAIDPDRLVFSLDCRNGKILSQCPELAGLNPVKALDLVQASSWREIILLDLARVGSAYGVNRSLAATVRTLFPDRTLLVGGGVKGPEEISELGSLGIEGVLVATALHQGILGPEHLSGLISNPPPIKDSY